MAWHKHSYLGDLNSLIWVILGDKKWEDILEFRCRGLRYGRVYQTFKHEIVFLASRSCLYILGVLLFILLSPFFSSSYFDPILY